MTGASLLNSLPACDNFLHLLITITNSKDPEFRPPKKSGRTLDFTLWSSEKVNHQTTKITQHAKKNPQIKLLLRF